MFIPSEIYEIIFEYLDDKSFEIIIFKYVNCKHFFINDTTMRIMRKKIDKGDITDKLTITDIILMAIENNIFLKYGFDKLGEQYFDDWIVERLIEKDLYYFSSVIDKIKIDKQLIEKILINVTNKKLILYSINKFLKINKPSELYLPIMKYCDSNLMNYIVEKNPELTELLTILKNTKELEKKLNLKTNYIYLLNEELLRYSINNSVLPTLLDLEYAILNHKNKYFNWAFAKISKLSKMDDYILYLCYMCFRCNNTIILEKLLKINSNINNEFYKMLKYKYPHIINTNDLIIRPNLDNYLLNYKETLKYYEIYD